MSRLALVTGGTRGIGAAISNYLKAAGRTVVATYAANDAAARAFSEATGIKAYKFDVGDFGNGSKFKYVANLLVAIHNVAAAEALVLAEQAGLDTDLVLAAVASGAGGSRMLEVRGPLMTGRAYGGAGGTIGPAMVFGFRAGHAAATGKSVD